MDHRLTEALLQGSGIWTARWGGGELWRRLIVAEVAPRSQYDTLIDLCRGDTALPGGILCLAGSGSDFHGQRGRSWSSVPGNIHLSVLLAPRLPVSRIGVGFSLLPAVAMVDCIDAVPGLQGRAGIKWVNDILVERAKVAGFLAHTQSLGGQLSHAVLGIGLNVESTPVIPADSFVSKAASLREFADRPGSCTLGVVLARLLRDLEARYLQLHGGGLDALREAYRGRSVVLGRQVSIREEGSLGEGAEIARGRVAGIGEALELVLEGREEPVTRGRLILLD